MPDRVAYWPWFALAFALYPVLHIAVSNPGETQTASVLAASTVVVVAASLCLLLLRAWLKSWYRAGLATMWVTMLFFSFGAVSTWIQELVKVPDSLDFALVGCCDSRLQHGHSAIWALLLVLGLLLARRLPAESRRAVGALNLVAAILIAMVAVRWIANAPSAEMIAERPATQAVTGGPRPDVYLIVLDGYARADVLKKYYGFDNQPFLDRLRAQGFSVLTGSTANYYWTDLSLPSMLNFDYLPALLGKGLHEKSIDRQGVYELIRDNAAARFLRARGYRFVHLQSTWGATGANPFADEFLPCGRGVFRDEFLRAVAQASWLATMSSRTSLSLAQCHLNNFEQLAALAREPGPKFVFVHFLPPHHPYLFDRDGRILRDARLTDQFDFQNDLWAQQEPYLAQLTYVNARIAAVVDRIVADSAQEPVIIIQSDHGPNLHVYEDAERRVIRFANLSAVLLPGVPRGWLPDDTTGVNLFPRIFNEAFGTKLPMRQPRFFTSAFDYPFALREVGVDGIRLERVPAPADNM